MAGRLDRLIPRRTRLPHYIQLTAQRLTRGPEITFCVERDTQKYDGRSLVTWRTHYIKTHFTCTHYSRNSLRLLSRSRSPRGSLSPAISDSHLRSSYLSRYEKPQRYALYIRYSLHFFLFTSFSLCTVTGQWKATEI